MVGGAPLLLFAPLFCLLVAMLYSSLALHQLGTACDGGGPWDCDTPSACLAAAAHDAITAHGAPPVLAHIFRQARVGSHVSLKMANVPTTACLSSHP